MLCIALWFYLRGFTSFGEGDVDVGYNYRGLRILSNMESRLSLVLAIGGAVMILFSLPVNNNDKDEDN